jgi:hypothetical protein
LERAEAALLAKEVARTAAHKVVRAEVLEACSVASSVEEALAAVRTEAVAASMEAGAAAVVGLAATEPKEAMLVGETNVVVLGMKEISLVTGAAADSVDACHDLYAGARVVMVAVS